MFKDYLLCGSNEEQRKSTLLKNSCYVTCLDSYRTTGCVSENSSFLNVAQSCSYFLLHGKYFLCSLSGLSWIPETVVQSQVTKMDCISYLLLCNTLPPNLHLLSQSFRGLGIWTQLTWLVCFMISHRSAVKVSAQRRAVGGFVYVRRKPRSR